MDSVSFFQEKKRKKKKNENGLKKGWRLPKKKMEKRFLKKYTSLPLQYRAELHTPDLVRLFFFFFFYGIFNSFLLEDEYNGGGLNTKPPPPTEFIVKFLNGFHDSPSSAPFYFFLLLFLSLFFVEFSKWGLVGALSPTPKK